MIRCDVLIVGGGPAGSSCALGLRQTGLDVVILDRKVFPRDKTCAGWITPKLVDTLHLDLEDYGRCRTLQPITGFRVGLIGGTPVEVPYGETVSYGIRRIEFDDYLLKRCGAILRLGEAFRDCERTSGGWNVNGEIEARLIIGAGGHFCPVARRLGVRSAKATGAVMRADVITAQEIEFRPDPDHLQDCRVAAETPELYFCRDLQGYGWCFRKGEYLNVGLGRTDSAHLSDHVSDFVDGLRKTGAITGPLPSRFHGHAYQLGQRVESRWVDDGVLLVGDSAGLAFPQSGEGIRPAVESGLVAARVIAAAGGDYSRSRLECYIDELRRQLSWLAPGRVAPGRRPGRSPARGLRLIPRAVRTALGRRLINNRLFAQHVVLDRWFLHRHRPAMTRIRASICDI